MEKIHQNNSQLKLAPFEAIQRFDHYSNDMKEALIRRSLVSLNTHKAGLSVGRLITLTAVFFIAPAWAFYVGIVLFLLLRERQKYINIYFERALRLKDVTIERIEHEVVVNGISRNVALCATFIAFGLVDSPLGATCAALFLVGHLFSYIYLNATVPRAVIFGSLPTILTLIAVTVIKVIQTGEITLFLPVAYFLIFAYSISRAVMNDALDNFELNSKVIAEAGVLEHALEKSQKEKELREDLELIAGVGTYSWNFETGEHFWSRGTYKLFGHDEGKPPYEREEFVSRIAPQYIEEYSKIMQMTHDNAKSFKFSFQFKSGDGISRFLSVDGSPFYDETGAAIGMKGMLIDQTAAYSNLEKLSEKQKLLNVALDNSASVILVYDISSKKANAYGALEALGIDSNSGLSSQELLEKLYSFLSPDDFKAISALIVKSKQTGKLESTEVKITHQSGKIIDVRYSVFFIAGEDENSGKLISFSTDITKEVERRNELSTALIEAERASRVKTEFLANMSHEIRTPLNGVIAVVGLLGKTKLDKEQREMVELIENSGDNLRDILNDVLDIARIESEKLEIEKAPFDLNEVVKSLSALFKARAEEKGLELRVELPKNIEHQFIGDANRIRQILSNFLSNAIKFTKDGKVALKVSVAKNLNPLGLQTLRFEVEDTGIGISRTNLSRLFERFEQIDGSITRQHGGSGLGLSISKSLAELMGGKIGATSKIGTGSRFKFELPLEVSLAKQEDQPEKFSDEHPLEEMAIETQKISILAVDDNPTNLRIIEMILTPLGVDLTLCENGLEAAESFAQAKFDVVLMDLQMPVLDGLSAMRIMRVQEKVQMNPRTPIIAVSASAMTHNVKEAIESGADFLIAKPFTPASLIEGVERALKLEDIEENARVTEAV